MYLLFSEWIKIILYDDMMRTDQEEVTAVSWLYYSAMDNMLRGKPSMFSPMLYRQSREQKQLLIPAQALL